MSCITRNNKDQITGVVLNNGQDSKLFDDLLKIHQNGTIAYNIYQQILSPAFQSIKHEYELDSNGEPVLKNKYTTSNNIESYLVKPSIISSPITKSFQIISGGQTGADLGALEGAKASNIKTGGTAPPNWISGNRSEKALLESYGLVEGEKDPNTYPKRTMKNVDNSDGTLAIMWGPSIGTSKTIGYAQTHKWQHGNAGSKDNGYKPVLVINHKDINEALEELKDFVKRNNIKTLNVAGHREKSQPGIQKFTKELIQKFLSKEQPTKQEETKKVDKDLNQKLQNILQKLYPEIKLNITNNPIWEQGDNIFNQEEYNNQVNYRLKATEKVLDNLSKIKQWESNKSIDQNTLWGKIGELGISKQQLELLRESEGNTIEEKLTSFIANYSYTVEINTAREKPKTEYGTSYYIKDGYFYQKNDEGFFKQLEGKNNPLIEISKEEYEKNQGSNTQHYSNLTVPGGTNYTENEISTPLITPSIKGHAQFSTDNGIGWFRSDEQRTDDNKGKKVPDGAGGLVQLGVTTDSKTRRILEVQSDLFQKGRDKEDLISKKGKYYRVLNINLGKDVTFEPKTYSEAFEQGEDGKWYPKYNKYGGYWRSNIPEISASKNIGSAVMGNWTASGMPQTTEFFIYELEDGVEPDYDISHLEIGDFKQLQEVRYRKPVKGKLIGEFKLTPDIYKIFNENYDLMSEDGGINKHYELEDEFEKKYGYRPYDEKAPEGVVEIFNKIQDDYWKEQSLKVEKALQSIHNKYDEQVKQNQFLQLLNKDNNWVTFFVKSIMQDSAKKGYEKVLFPSGNTASKVEGHTTLEEFKKQKEDRIKELEKREITHTLDYAKKFNNPDGKLWSIANSTFTFKTKEEAESFTKTKEYNLEIEQLKQELERVEKEGFGALKPIYNFYENTVTNILKKQGYKPEVITDEYGNTWNEVTLNQVRDLANILLQRNEANQIIGQANIKALSVLIDAVNQKQDTLPHEYAHHYIAWYRNTPIVQEAIKKWGSEEALVQSIGEQAVIQKGEAWSWWKRFTTWLLNKLNKLSSLDKQELTQILTDAFLTRQNLNQTTQSEKQTSDIWSQNKESIQSKFPDLTEDQFNQMTEQEKTKFIKCYL